MKHSILLHVLVGVRVDNIEAEDDLDAIRKAEEVVRENDYLFRKEGRLVGDDMSNTPFICYADLSQEDPPMYALVDHEGDENSLETRSYSYNRLEESWTEDI